MSETGEKMLRAAMPRLLKSLTSAIAHLLLHEAGLTVLHPMSWKRYREALKSFLDMVDEHAVDRKP